MGSRISTACSSLGAPSPPHCQRTLCGRTGNNSGFPTRDLGAAATPHCHQNPRAVDFRCRLELCGPWWGTGLGFLTMSVITIQHHLCGMMGSEALSLCFVISPVSVSLSPLLPFLLCIRLDKKGVARRGPAICCYLEAMGDLWVCEASVKKSKHFLASWWKNLALDDDMCPWFSWGREWPTSLCSLSALCVW